MYGPCDRVDLHFMVPVIVQLRDMKVGRSETKLEYRKERKKERKS